jgi:hypothetical protein
LKEIIKEWEDTGITEEALLRGKERYDIVYMDILANEFYEKNKIYGNNICNEVWGKLHITGL